MRQHTLKQAVRAGGVGLHTGDRVYLTLKPGAPNSGIVFRRTDLPGKPSIAARADKVLDTRLSTCLVEGDVRVATIEHLMSAFAGMGVDNAVVEIDASEIPILDGSAAPFLLLIKQAGIIEQREARQYLRVKRPLEVRVHDKLARFEPFDGFKMDYTIEFDHPVFKDDLNRIVIDFAHQPFVSEMARARTFGFVNEVEAMRKAGLGRGASLENAIVVDDFHILNEGGLRFPGEFVKHKALDAIGDLYLAGHPILGFYTAVKSGHALNNQLLRLLISDPDNMELVQYTDAASAPVVFALSAA